MATIFAAFGKSLGNNKGSVQNFGIVGITIASEEFTKFIFFYCPCDFPRNQMYGTCFIWGPAFVLLIVGYLANRRTWRLTTGLCNRTQSFLGKGKKRIFHFIYIFCSIGMKAMIAPATWVVLAFLKGDYYACAHWPDPYNYQAVAREYYQIEVKNGTLPKPCLFNPNPAKFNPSSDAEIIARTLRAESHIIGWLYLTMGMLVAVAVMFTFRCYSNFSYEQTNYIDRYRANEVELFEEKLDEKSKELAQRIVDGYFSKPRAKEDWDKIAVINDKVTRSKRGKAIYSPLHRFVNKEMNKSENDENETEEVKKIKEEIVKGNLVKDAAVKKKHKPTHNGKKSASHSGSGSPSVIPMNVMSAPSTRITQKINCPPQKETQHPPNPTEKTNNSTPKPETSLAIVDETAKKSPSKIETESAPEQDHPEKVSIAEKSPSYEEEIKLKPEPISENIETSQPVTVTPNDDSRSESGSIRETSLGDFGGYFSREDVSRLEDVDGEPGVEQDDEREEESEASVQDEEDHEVEDQKSDEMPLLQQD